MTDGYHLGGYAQVVSAAADRLDAESVPARLHAHDYTLWSDDPTEISDRLAWLTLPTDMATQVADLCRFATTLRDEGCRHVVLLGMGGSSLGPEVIRQTIGNSVGYPQMLTLDSTVPDWVAATTAGIEPARTVFVLSSKSGTTTEPNAFYAYFRDLMAGQVGVNDAGRRFLAVTDPETALVRLAQTGGFRRVFLNDPNVGGRYSVLSHFGFGAGRAGRGRSGAVAGQRPTNAAALPGRRPGSGQPRRLAGHGYWHPGEGGSKQIDADRFRQHRRIRLVDRAVAGRKHR